MHAEGRKWLWAEYEVGDVVVHHPFMVHASAVNGDEEGRIKLATDLLFVETGKLFDERWMKVNEVSIEGQRAELTGSSLMMGRNEVRKACFPSWECIFRSFHLCLAYFSSLLWMFRFGPSP